MNVVRSEQLSQRSAKGTVLARTLTVDCPRNTGVMITTRCEECFRRDSAKLRPNVTKSLGAAIPHQNGVPR
jgi:hypothetical protein